MIKNCWVILPVFVVQWFARRYCERFTVAGRVYAMPFKDVLIDVTAKFK